MYRALLDLDAHNNTDLIFWRKPDEVRTKASFKKKELVLVPVAPMINITMKNTSSGSGYSLGRHQVGDSELEFFVIPVQKPPAQSDQFPKDSVVAAFWWVASTHDKKLVNMTLEHVTQNGVTLPVLTNHKEIKPSSKLWMLAKPSPESAAAAAAKKQRQ